MGFGLGKEEEFPYFVDVFSTILGGRDEDDGQQKRESIQLIMLNVGASFKGSIPDQTLSTFIYHLSTWLVK